ncbi:MAG: glycosyltransferase family 4 protein [Candidatus Methanosuratincola sp.]
MTRKVVHYVDSTTFGGNEQALIHLLEHTNRDHWQPVLFHPPEPGIRPLLEEAHRLHVRTRVVPRMQGLSAISGLPAFIREIREERPAVFHAHLNWLLSCKYGLAAAALSGVPLIVATLQQYLQPPWGRNIAFQQRIVSVFVDQYIAVSDAIARQLYQDFGVQSGKVKVIRNSIPYAQYSSGADPELRAVLDRGTGWPVVLTVARLDNQKGHRFLLEAICRLPETVLVLAGDGPERVSLEELVNHLGLSERVLFLGYRCDVPELLGSCDIFVLPSLYEGLPLSVLEAMAAGKTVVATAVGGTSEAVQDGETGFLVPPGDPAALAEAIQRVLADPGLAQKMGAAGKERVRREFSVEAMAQGVNQIYEKFMAKRELSAY